MACVSRVECFRDGRWYPEPEQLQCVTNQSECDGDGEIEGYIVYIGALGIGVVVVVIGCMLYCSRKRNKGNLRQKIS